MANIDAIFLNYDGSVNLFGSDTWRDQYNPTILPDKYRTRQLIEPEIIWWEVPKSNFWDGKPADDLPLKVMAKAVMMPHCVIPVYLDNTISASKEEDGTEIHPFSNLNNLYKFLSRYQFAIGCLFFRVYCNGNYLLSDFSVFDKRVLRITQFDGLNFDAQGDYFEFLNFCYNSTFTGQGFVKIPDVVNCEFQNITSEIKNATQCKFNKSYMHGGRYFQCSSEDSYDSNWRFFAYDCDFNLKFVPGNPGDTYRMYCTKCRLDYIYHVKKGSSYNGRYIPFAGGWEYEVPSLGYWHFLPGNRFFEGRLDECQFRLLPETNEMHYEFGKPNVEEGKDIMFVHYLQYRPANIEYDELKLNFASFGTNVKVEIPRIISIDNGFDSFYLGEGYPGEGEPKQHIWIEAMQGAAIGQVTKWGKTQYRKDSDFEINFMLPPCSNGGNGVETSPNSGTDGAYGGGRDDGLLYLNAKVGQGGMSWDGRQAGKGYKGYKIFLDGLGIAQYDSEGYYQSYKYCYSLLPDPNAEKKIYPKNCHVKYGWPGGSVHATFNAPRMLSSLPEELQ